MFKLKNLIIASLAFIIAACNTTPEKAIVKKWKLSDVIGKDNRHGEFSKQSEKHSSEIEFTKDGKCLMYADGILKQTLPYTIASDGKSLLLTDPSGKEGSMSMEILKLNSNELELKADKMSDDTVVYRAE